MCIVSRLVNAAQKPVVVYLLLTLNLLAPTTVGARINP